MNEEAILALNALEQEYMEASNFLQTLEHAKRFDAEGIFVVEFIRQLKAIGDTRQALFIAVTRSGVTEEE